MHVVCVWNQAFCIFGPNCLLAGRSDALRAMTFDRHKVVMDITFAAWCEVNIEFAELLWMLGFGFDMSEENVRRYVRKHVKRYVRKNVRRYVRKNAKRYVRKMSERISEDMSERMSEDISEDMSERMSKDMSERTSEDCFQSVCEVGSYRTHFRR